MAKNLTLYTLKMSILKQYRLFEVYSDDVLETISQFFQIYLCEPQETIVKAGTPVDGLYFIGYVQQNDLSQRLNPGGDNWFDGKPFFCKSSCLF